jgi:hypothetical protein
MADAKERANDPGHVALLRDLEAKPPSAAKEKLLKRARAYEFHCDHSESPMPKTDLAVALVEAGYMDLVEKIDQYDNEIALTPAEEKLMKTAEAAAAKVANNEPRGNRAMARFMQQLLKAAAADTARAATS